MGWIIGIAVIVIIIVVIVKDKMKTEAQNREMMQILSILKSQGDVSCVTCKSVMRSDHFCNVRSYKYGRGMYGDYCSKYER